MAIAGCCHRVVAGITVHVQLAFEALEKTLGMMSVTPGRVEERRAGAGPDRPRAAGRGPAPTGTPCWSCHGTGPATAPGSRP